MTDETKDIKKEEENSADYGSTSQPSDKFVNLDEIYTMIGFGKSQYLYYLLVALVAYSDYAEIMVLSVILPSLRCEWDLTPALETAITISVYGSYAVFAVLFGRVADRYGRKAVIKWSTLALVLAAIGGAAAPNKWLFLVTRLVTGASIGVNLTCIVCYSTEFAESDAVFAKRTISHLFSLKGILHQKNFYRLNLIFWIVMGCGRAA